MPTTDNPWQHAITITIDEAMLSGVTDQTLATWWHVAQANPADGFATSDPGNLANRIGGEIIRRWLASAPVELWHHQGRHYYWHQLTQLGKWNEHGQFVPHPPASRTGPAATAAGQAQDGEVPR